LVVERAVHETLTTSRHRRLVVSPKTKNKEFDAERSEALHAL
jgi:hypothetical protein